MQWSIIHTLKGIRDFPGGTVVKNLPANAGDMGSIPGRGTKSPQVTCHGQKKQNKKQPNKKCIRRMNTSPKKTDE